MSEFKDFTVSKEKSEYLTSTTSAQRVVGGNMSNKLHLQSLKMAADFYSSKNDPRAERAWEEYYAALNNKRIDYVAPIIDQQS